VYNYAERRVRAILLNTYRKNGHDSGPGSSRMGLCTRYISDNILKADDHADNIVGLIFDINFPVADNNLGTMLDLFPFAFNRLSEFLFQLLKKLP
jgi:hypothetical protein